MAILKISWSPALVRCQILHRTGMYTKAQQTNQDSISNSAKHSNACMNTQTYFLHYLSAKAGMYACEQCNLFIHMYFWCRKDLKKEKTQVISQHPCSGFIPFGHVLFFQHSPLILLCKPVVAGTILATWGKVWKKKLAHER